jgi:hypothetical protein
MEYAAAYEDLDVARQALTLVGQQVPADSDGGRNVAWMVQQIQAGEVASATGVNPLLEAMARVPRAG